MSINYNNDNTFIFTFVRMNPPTPGHLLIIEAMIKQALKLNVDKIFVILSNTMDDKNPIPCSYDTIAKPKSKKLEALIASNSIDYAFKSEILHEMIEVYKRNLISSSLDEEEQTKITDLSIKIICSSGNPFSFINSMLFKEFIEKGIRDINLFFIVGQDRVGLLDNIVKNFASRSYIKSIDAEILPREGMAQLLNEGPSEIAIKDIPLQQYSASFVRKLVKEDKKAEFIEVYRSYLDESQINKLYDSIKNGLMIYNKQQKPIIIAQKGEEEEEEEEAEEQSYYVKNNLLPIIKGGLKNKYVKSKKIKKIKKNITSKLSKKRKKNKKSRKYKKK